MRAVIGLAVALFLSSSTGYPAQERDSTTIGGMTFDFAAPAAPLTAAQHTFFEKYKNAVNAHDENALVALQDPAQSECKFDGRQILLRDLRNTIPDNAKVRFFPAKSDVARELGLGDFAYLPVAPTTILGVSFRSETKERISIVQIFRPVRQTGENFTLVPYCLTEKGRDLLRQKGR